MTSGLVGRRNKTVAVGVFAMCIGLALLISGGVLGAEPPQHLASFGPDGTAATNFENVGPLAVDQETGAVYVGDPMKQALFKFDEEGNPINFGGAAGYIAGNEISGLAFNTANPGQSQAAVDSETHVIYVTSNQKIRAFEANGEPHEFVSGPGAGSSEIPGASTLAGVAVDRFGNIYASDFGDKKVRIYARTGALITVFAPESESKSILSPSNVAVASNGTLYITDYINPVFRFVPSSFPVKASTTYSQGRALDDEISVTPMVDPATDYVYIGQQDPTGTEFRIAVYDEGGTLVGALGAPGEAGELNGPPLGVAVNGEGERVYVAVNNPGSGYVKVEIFGTFAIPEGPPSVTGTSVTGLTSTSATLRAKINSNTLVTTYRFEYGTISCASSPGACTEVPTGGASIGSGHTFVPVLAKLYGLLPGAVYYYRVVAENALGVTEGPVRTFRVQSSISGSPSIDERVWEQITPSNKFGGVITNAGLVQGSLDGNGIAFQTRGSIEEEPEGNRTLEPSAVLARRTSDGWRVEDLVPPHTEAGGLGFGPEFKLFSTDLDRAVFEPRDDTPLSFESSERTPYLRTNTSPPAYRPLVTSKEGSANVPPGTEFGGEANGERNPVSIAGANGDLTHIIVWSEAPLMAGAAVRSLYQWVDGILKPVSVLPEDEGGAVVFAQLGSGVISGHHAVSQDGSRVFWSPGDNSQDLTDELPISALYVRDMENEETARIDVVQSTATGSGEAHPTFMGASADGTVVFFTDLRQLTEGASVEGRDLYRCEVGNIGGSLGCTELENLSNPPGGSGESAKVQELSQGISDDGSKLYFVAEGILDAEPNQFGDHAETGKPNMYVWQEGEGVRFIATLSSRDDPVWGEPGAMQLGHSAKLGASTSPSGRYLTFMSERNLTGAESNDPDSGEFTEQVFLYDTADDNLMCVSCNPNGATDAGRQIVAGASEGGVIFPDPQQLWSGRWVGATLPEPTEGEPTVGYALYHPRAVLDNGRVFFNSFAPLVAADSNRTWDVYQYEPLGVGSCSAVAGTEMVVVTASGCVGLISSGTDEEPSVFMDASASGDDVFFATFARLSVLDTDGIVDIYDARVNGVAAVAEQHAECIGEGCMPGVSPPNDPSPSSSSYNGAGNIKAKPRKHCRRGQRKVRRKGKVKCVPRGRRHGKQWRAER